MILMRLAQSLVFCFAFIASTLFGNLSCEQTLSKISSSNDYQRLGVDLAATRPKIKELLESTRAELLSPKAPSFEELENLDLKSWKIGKQMKAGDPFTEPKSLASVLKLFEQVREDADYLFVGNGYYIPYLIARSAFAGTPMADRIKFVAFSRDLARKADENPELVSDYFKSLGIGNTKSPKKIIVIDSITSLESGNKHSVIRTSNAIRRHLIDEGWPQSDAIRSVITLAMPEGDPSHSYRTRSLDEYYRKVSEIPTGGLRQAVVPYFDPGIPFDQSPFIDSYEHSGDGHYWNGKYNQLDSQGIPRGIEDIRKSLDKIPLQELREVLNDRAQKASFYQEIISYQKKNALLYQKEISKILTFHHLR